MTTEQKKKNPDYSVTAINLCNPQEVYTALVRLHNFQNKLTAKKDALKALNPDLFAEIELLENCITEETSKIKSLIQQHGSYQDAEAGEYALIYERKTPVYDADAFEARYPKLAPAVLVKAVDVKTLEGLIKSGRLDKTDLETSSLATGEATRPVITYKVAQCTVIQ